MYRTSLHNPKIGRLSDRQHRVWHNCLLMADDTGVLPKMCDVAYHMRMTTHEAEQIVSELVECGLVDIQGAGPARSFKMHDWSVHQYVSDSSTERVKKFRNKNKEKKPATAMKRFSNATVTVPDTDTDTDTERDSPPVRHAPDIETAPPEPQPKTKAPPKTGDIEAGFEAWARVASDYGLPACKSVSEARRKRMAKRLKVAGGPEAFEAVLRKEIAGSGFLRGRKAPKPGHKPFKADVDFVLQDASWDRIVDGFYADAPGTPPAAPSGPASPSGGRGAQPEVYVHPQAEDAACAGMTLEEYRANIERLRALGKVAKQRVTHNAGQYRLDCSEQIGDASKSHGGRHEDAC